ncbi:MAG: hypothetical protein HY791_00595 [Deltaproteobacteria bacterium]|nr:hypothetical protein [Deltaproteobacteria bacterium]
MRLRRELGVGALSEFPELTLTSTHAMWFEPNLSAGDTDPDVLPPTMTLHFSQTHRGYTIVTGRTSARFTDLALTTIEGRPVPASKPTALIDAQLAEGLADPSQLVADLQTRCPEFDTAIQTHRKLNGGEPIFDVRRGRLVRLLYCSEYFYVYDAVTGGLLESLPAFEEDTLPDFDYVTRTIAIRAQRRGSKTAIAPQQWFRFTNEGEFDFPYSGVQPIVCPPLGVTPRPLCCSPGFRCFGTPLTEDLPTLIEQKIVSSSRCDYRYSVNHRGAPSLSPSFSTFPFPSTGLDGDYPLELLNESCTQSLGLRALGNAMFDVQNAHYQIVTAATHALTEPDVGLFAWRWVPPAVTGPFPNQQRFPSTALGVDVRSSESFWLPNLNGRYNQVTGNIILNPWNGTFSRAETPVHEWGHFILNSYFDIGLDHLLPVDALAEACRAREGLV